MFEMLDIDKEGTIASQEFIDGVQKTLNLWLSIEECNSLLQFLDVDKSGAIELGDFFEKLTSLQQSQGSKERWMCSKSNMMTAISDEYEAKQLKDYQKLQDLFNQVDENKEGMVHWSKFEKLCRETEANIDPLKIKQIFNKALEKSESKDALTASAFATAALQMNLGGYGTGIF